MSGKFIAAALIVVGAIHLLPVAGVLGPERLSGMYGVRVDGHDMEVLMRHRAVLFGLLGLFLVAAAFKPQWQMPAFIGGGASMASFIWLAWRVGGSNDAIRRIVYIDAAALAILCIAAVAAMLRRS